MNEEASEIFAFITGAGGAAGVMYLWIRSLLSQNESLSDELKEERERNNEYGESIVSIATEAKLHIAASAKCADEVKSHITEEAKKTRTAIRIRQDEREIKND